MLKCSKEAFAACPDRKGCGCLEEATFTEGSECDMFNRQIGSHVMTHGDQIRAMSDEDLAVTILCIRHGERPWCDESCETTSAICENCIAKWLKQPAEVSGDGV